MKRFEPYEVKVPGKWVLSGEHSVLRGAPAVAVPHTQFFLKLGFYPNDSGKLQVLPEIQEEPILQIIHEVFEEKGLDPKKELSGKLFFENSIPIGAGFGSSAALCVALSHFLAPWFNLSMHDIPSFATKLEDRFHGKSSGMDVTVCEAGKPLWFRREKKPKILKVTRFPHFTFHDTHLRFPTIEAVEKVNSWVEKHPIEAQGWDEKMEKASLLGVQGLEFWDRGERSLALKELKASMDLSFGCFETWGLVPDKVKSLRDQLLSKGALGVRLTGAGLGGFLVALWEEPTV